MKINNSKLTRIGVFYDGSYFLHVSNYYAYHHDRRSRISVEGLHDFIRQKVAEEEEKLIDLCPIVDAHYFRGRLTAQEANAEGNRLFYDRLFDDILMMEGITTHYLPVRSINGFRQERGIDIWMALEAYELALLKQFDVVVLVASDIDFLPLVRKLNTLGVRVMMLCWDYEFYDEEGRRKTTITHQDLLDEVAYPIPMHHIIDNAEKHPIYNPDKLFVERKKYITSSSVAGETTVAFPENSEVGEIHKSTVFRLKDGYGFITFPQTNNLFFHHSSLIEADFNEVREGDAVEFSLGKNDRGEPVAKNVKLV